MANGLVGSYLDPLGFAIGQGLGGGVNYLMENRDRKMLEQALNQQQATNPLAIGGMGGLMANGLSMPPVQMPNFLSQRYRDMGTQMDAATLQGMLPLGPMEEAERQRVLAQTRYYDASAQSAGMQDPRASRPQVAQEGDQTGLSPGTVYQYDRYGSLKVIKEPATEAELLDTDIKRQNLAMLIEDKDARFSPEDRKAFQQIEVNLKQQDLLARELSNASDPKKREQLQLQIEDLRNKVNDPVDRRLRDADDKLRRLEENGKTDTQAHADLEQRWNELAKLKSAGTTVNINPASAGERTALAEGASMIDALSNMKTLFDTVVSGSGLLAYPGPIRGPLESLKGVFEKSPLEKEEFRAATFAFTNAMIKAITGAQMGEAEATRIKSQIPAINDPPTRWMAKWRQSMLNIEEVQERRKQVLSESDLKVPEMGGESSPVPMKNPAEMTEAEIEAELRSMGGR